MEWLSGLIRRHLQTRLPIGYQRLLRRSGWWAGRESNPQSFRGGFTDRWARHVPFADPALVNLASSYGTRFASRLRPAPIMAPK